MPTAPPRQAQTRLRNRHSTEQVVELSSDALPTQTLDMDALMAEAEQESRDIIDEDISDEGK